MDLKPGRYSLRLAAHSAATNKSGSVYCDIDVPDFARERLSLSGLVLGVTPGMPSAPKDAFAAFIPIIPTTAREFAAGASVTAFVRVYQGGRDPLVAVVAAARVEDRSGIAVLDTAETLGPAQFSTGRAADYRLELPIARLTPGPHLLTIGATMGRRTATRGVRFAVR
jgi:hypothetical protein